MSEPTAPTTTTSCAEQMTASDATRTVPTAEKCENITPTSTALTDTSMTSLADECGAANSSPALHSSDTANIVDSPAAVIQSEIATSNSPAKDCSLIANNCVDSEKPAVANVSEQNCHMAEVKTTESVACREAADDVAPAAAAAADSNQLSASAIAAPISSTARMSEQMEMSQMRVRLVVLEKTNATLRLELKNTELIIEAKEKVDAKKTRLVELLDRKMESLQAKNSHLLDMMEGMVKEKDARTARLVEATRHMEDLSKKLSDSERMKTELRSVNQQLKKMLENIEGKGTRIARMAKEKVLKYKEENMNLQQQLDDMKTGGGACAATFESVPVTEVADDDVACQMTERWSELDDIQQRLQTAFSDNTDAEADVVRVSKTAVETELRRLHDVLISLRASFDEHVTEMRIFKAQQKELEHENSCMRGKLSQVADDKAASYADLAKIIENKDKDIVQLKEELNRLKTAIGQLVGLNLSTVNVV